MFGRTVTIEGRKIFVTCTPRTPLSEVLRRAADQLKREEVEAAEQDPTSRAYRAAVDALWRSPQDCATENDNG